MFLLILLLLLRTSIGNPSKPVQLGTFEQDLLEPSWVIDIRIHNQSDSNRICGGVAIKDNVILSAAHCFYNDTGNQVPSSMFEIVFPLKPHLKVDIKNLFVHPQYDYNSRIHDIVMIETSSSLTDLGVALLQVADQHFSPSWSVAALWGYRDHAPSYKKVQLVTNIYCNMLFHLSRFTNRKINGNQICGFGIDTDISHGDSGGPLICFNEKNDPELCGIVSFGLPKGEGSLPVVFTNVGAYLPFIDFRANANSRLPERVILIYIIAFVWLLMTISYVVLFCVYNKTCRMTSLSDCHSETVQKHDIGMENPASLLLNSKLTDQESTSMKFPVLVR